MSEHELADDHGSDHASSSAIPERVEPNFDDNNHTRERLRAPKSGPEYIQLRRIDSEPSEERSVPPTTVSQLKHRKPAPWIERIWFWELAACALAVACLVAIVGALIYEDGRRLDQWRLFIAPNALVAFLGTLSKSCMLLALSEVISQDKWLHFRRDPQKIYDLQLFDSASRGPGGAALFLLQKHRHVAIASIAALAVLLSLLVDPFIQLVFSFLSRQVPSDDLSASIEMTTVWDSGMSASSTQQTVTQLFSIDMKVQAAVFQGLYLEELVRPARCATGRCQWSTLNTLGVCASCRNITSSVSSEPIRETNLSPARNFSTGVKYTFPSGSRLTAWSGTTIPDFRHVTTYTLWNSTRSLGSESADLFGIYEFEAVSRTPSIDSGGRPGPPGHVSCWHCVFNFCSKTYDNVTVLNGTVTLPTPRDETLYQYRRNDGASNMNYGTTNSSGHFSYAVNYTVNSGDQLALGSYLVELFEVGYWANGAPYRPNLPTDQLRTLIAPNIGPSLSQSTDIDATMRSMANSLSEYIRTSNGSVAQPGIAYENVTFIEVQWGWLALPIILTALTCGVLIFTIVETSRSGAVPWKSSGLALLLYELEGWDVPEDAFSSRRELERNGKMMEGTLVEKEGPHVFLARSLSE